MQPSIALYGKTSKHWKERHQLSWWSLIRKKSKGGTWKLNKSVVKWQHNNYFLVMRGNAQQWREIHMTLGWLLSLWMSKLVYSIKERIKLISLSWHTANKSLTLLTMEADYIQWPQVDLTEQLESGMYVSRIDQYWTSKMTKVVIGSQRFDTTSSMTNLSSLGAQAHSCLSIELVQYQLSHLQVSMDSLNSIIQTHSTWALVTCQ